MQEIVLKSQLYVESGDLCAELTNEQLKSKDGVQMIIGKTYERDFLSVIIETSKVFHKVSNTSRDGNESLKNFEMRFSAVVEKFNYIFATSKLPQCIAALMLKSNAEVEQ